MEKSNKILSGKYEILGQTGEGGCGVVYRAWDRHLERLVAIKTGKKGETPEEARILREEMEMLKVLKHPMLPVLYDYFYEDGQYLVMEYIPGESLHNYIAREGSVPEEKTREWALQLLDLLSYLHAQKPPVIYRDLKPENIMVCPEGNLRVVDFGAAYFARFDGPYRGSLAGSAGYAAPEQLPDMEGIGNRADERSDIYTFGATCYHMLTGYHPALPPYGVRPVRYMRPELTYDIEAIVAKCTRTEPAKRYQSAEEIARELRRGKTGRGFFFAGRRKKKGEYVIRRMEKKVWLTEKKTTGLLGFGFFLGIAVLGMFSFPVRGREAPLPVTVYNTQGQKLVIRFDTIYTPDGNFVFEVKKDLFEKDSLQELSITLTDCATGEKRERVFSIRGTDTQAGKKAKTEEVEEVK